MVKTSDSPDLKETPTSQLGPDVWVQFLTAWELLQLLVAVRNTEIEFF